MTTSQRRADIAYKWAALFHITVCLVGVVIIVWTLLRHIR
jgi:hypothetical protein